MATSRKELIEYRRDAIIFKRKNDCTDACPTCAKKETKVTEIIIYPAIDAKGTTLYLKI